MKKTLLIIIFCSMILMSSGCIKDGDSHLARTKMLTLFDYIEKNENEKIKELFSPIIKEDISDMDNKINEMCEFVKGEYKSITSLGLGSSVSYDYGKEVRTFDMYYIIETSSNEYYFSILWKIKDDYEEKNIGIWSLYLEEKINENPPTPRENWENGINLIY